MKKEKIIEIIKDALRDVVEVNEISIPTEINQKTPLYGNRGYLDSLALVSLIVVIEEKFAKEGENITIASEKAFSRKISPFLSVETLARFIEELIYEK